jgi:simple sugar transport system permease protein
VTGVVGDLAALFSVGVLASGARLAVPAALAAIGEAVSQRAGVFNLGIEGMMMVGAFTGFAVASGTGSKALGVLAGAAGGAAIAMLMVMGTVWRGTNVIVTGFSLVLLGQGIANLLYAQNQGSLKTFEPMGEVRIGPLADIPVLGPVLFHQNVVFYLAVILAVLVSVLLSRTRFGLEVDASGADPVAAAGKGVAVRRTRAIAVLAAGLCAGLGGAAITVGSVGNFGSNITAGKGFVALALVAVARNRVGWVVVAAFLFGTLEAAQARLQDVEAIPVEFLPAIPWIAVVLALLALALVRLGRLRRAS